MKKFQKITTLLLACCMLTACVGCGSDDDTDSAADSSAAQSDVEDDASEAEAEDSAQDEDTFAADSNAAENESEADAEEEAQADADVDAESQADTESEADAQEESDASAESDLPYQLSYETNIPSELAHTIGQYFYAIYTQDYDLYLAQINPTYQTAMDELLQEDYGYGMEVDFEQYHQALLNYAGTEDFTITSISMALAEEALAEDFEEGTDFVGEYLDAYAEFLGDDFVAQLEEESTAIYDIALTMLGEDADGNALMIMDQLEILVVDTDGTYGILG